jgi:tRNA A37 N6-isopentenylltransferase MiaA
VVQACSKNLSTFKKDREDKDSAIKKRLDDLSQGLQQANAKVSDIQTQKQSADEALKKATRADEIVNAQGAKFQELENHLVVQRSLIDEL